MKAFGFGFHCSSVDCVDSTFNLLVELTKFKYLNIQMTNEDSHISHENNSNAKSVSMEPHP